MTGTPGQAAYEAYRATIMSVMPRWADLSIPAGKAWEAAAKAAVEAAQPVTGERPDEIRRALEAALTPDAATERIADLLAQLERAQDSAVDGLRAFAQDEILANAGADWDRPLGPEQNAVEYVRHLEQAIAAVTAERDAACEQSAVARERLRNLSAGQPPELTAAMAETRQVRNVLARVFGSFSVPDQRRMRHASVTAATIERWKTDAGLDAATTAKEG